MFIISQDVLSNHSININVRWLAVMCFKNGVDRYWRRNAPNAISEEEKVKLRQGLLTTSILSEPVAQIATQQAVLISKIARYVVRVEILRYIFTTCET